MREPHPTELFPVSTLRARYVFQWALAGEDRRGEERERLPEPSLPKSLVPVAAHSTVQVSPDLERLEGPLRLEARELARDAGFLTWGESMPRMDVFLCDRAGLLVPSMAPRERVLQMNLAAEWP